MQNRRLLSRGFTFAAVLTLSFVLLAPSVLAVSGSINLLSCNGTAATWRHSPVTVRIDNVAGVGSSVVSAAAAAITEWNNALSNAGFTGFSLSQVSSGSADIVIQLYFKIVPGYILGATSISCGGDNLSSASIQLGVKGLSLMGVKNVAAHELGHALGLGHAIPSGDLMYASFDQTERKNLVCPSNLDAGGIQLSSNFPSATLSFSVITWQVLSC